jgi:hypothetical protein
MVCEFPPPNLVGNEILDVRGIVPRILEICKFSWSSFITFGARSSANGKSSGSTRSAPDERSIRSPSNKHPDCRAHRPLPEMPYLLSQPPRRSIAKLLVRYLRRFRALECWSTGALEHWSTGVLEYWSTGVLEYWSTGVLEHWSTGVLEYWSTGVLEYWSTGALEYWSTWVLGLLECPDPICPLLRRFPTA